MSTVTIHASFAHLRRHNAINQEYELMRLIHSRSLARLRDLINLQNGCENDAKTIKSLVSFLFFSVINSRCSNDRSSHEYAVLTKRILEVIPDESRDWLSPTTDNGHQNKGKPLFCYLILECAQSYLERDKTNTLPSEEVVLKVYGHNADKATTLRSLKDAGKFLLVEFVGELVLLNLLPRNIIYRYCLKLIGSTTKPRPSPSALEAICRLLRVAGPFTKSEQWSNTIFSALERVPRDGEHLEATLRILLLVCTLNN